MTAIEKIIDYAKSQIGTAENPLGSNKQKYGALIDSTDWYLYKDGTKTWRHLVNGYDWCTQFVDASFITCFTIDVARKILFRPQYNNYGAVVKYAFNYFKNAGHGYTKEAHDPNPGDVVYFQNSKGLSHTGIVIETTSSSVTTVEGNSGTNNYYVAKHTYTKTSSYIYGYGVPDYKSIDPEPDPKEMDGYKVESTYEVIHSDLQIRKGPGTTYETTGTLEQGSTVTCLALKHDSEGNTWLQHESGWSCGLYKGVRYISDVEITTEWIKDNGKWYYYNASGKLVKNKWQLYKGNWYYLGQDGAMLTGWQTIEGCKYYFYLGDDGHMASSEWIEGLPLDADGCQKYNKTSSWKSNSSGKWYEDQLGWYPTSRTLRIDGVDYEFDSKGYVVIK